MNSKQYFRTLTIAGSDSGGGAGIQADLKTFSALQCYGMSVLTSLTAQNTIGVQSVFEVSPSFVRSQIQSVLSDIGVDAVKIGMLYSSEIIRAVAFELSSFDVQKIVLDPVMVAKSGQALLMKEAVSTLREFLLPRCLILTPNLPEAETLIGKTIQTENEMEQAGREILKMGPTFVVMKGGHLVSKGSPDCIVFRKGAGDIQSQWLNAERIQTRNSHGTGCTFSAAIASGLAKGFQPIDAISIAKDYLTKALAYGADYQLGQGQGPVHHFFDCWNEMRDKN